MDSRGHHCRQCCAGGDHATRHNEVRNKVLAFASIEAGVAAEPEKPDLLLPPRPDATANQRRPADVDLPSWYGGLPTTLDLAVTSPQHTVGRQSCRQGSPARCYVLLRD